MPLQRPSETVGKVWGTQCLDQTHIEPRQNVSNRDFFLGGGKAKINHVVIRDLFVVNRDKKKHDSRQEDHESRFFSSLGMALILGLTEETRGGVHSHT